MALMLFPQLYKEFNHRIFKIIPVCQKYTLRNMGVVHRYLLVRLLSDSLLSDITFFVIASIENSAYVRLFTCAVDP